MSATDQPPVLKAVKKKLRLKKSDVAQCRLCLRVLSRACFRETRGNANLELRQKIWDAVAVRVVPNDRVSMVCTNCIRLVNIVTGFRISCRQADTIYELKPTMLHPGSWMKDKNQKLLENCLALVDRNRAEMTGLIRMSGLKEVKLKEVEKVFIKQEENVTESEEESKTKEDETSRVNDLLIKKENPEEQIPEKMDIPSLEVLLNQTTEKVMEPPTQEVLDEILGPPTQEVPNNPTEKVDLVGTNKSATRKPDGTLHRKYPMCDICGSWIFKDKEGHMNKHRNVKPYPCTAEGCTVHSYSQRTRRYHIQYNHSEEALNGVECQLCHKKVKPNSLPGHMHKVHSKAGRKPCSICGKLLFACYLKDHMAAHANQRAYKCDQCGQKFNAQTNWITHRKKHLNEQISTVK